jgi:hypothetical protein
MRSERSFLTRFPAFVIAMAFSVPAGALTGVQVGASGMTYASADMQCGLHPVTGMAPMVQAGLYNPKKNASATVSLNGTAFATVTFASPEAIAWLANGPNTVVVTVNKPKSDSYSFDAQSAQPNVCIPDTTANTVSGELEYAFSGKSYATVNPGCAMNGLTGRAQPYVNLFDSVPYVLLNVSINNVPLTQLYETRPHTPVFLAAGLNVISAAYGAISTDFYVRDGGTGICTLP